MMMMMMMMMCLFRALPITNSRHLNNNIQNVLHYHHSCFIILYISLLNILAEHFINFLGAGVLLSGFICYLRQPSQLIVYTCHSTLYRSVLRSGQHVTNCTQNRLCQKYGHSHYAAL